MIWLIGYKGMLGADVESRLNKSGYDYFVSDIEADITDLSSLRKFVDGKAVEWIVNCSAYTAVDKAEDEPELAEKINGQGVLNIAEIAKEKGAVLIHLSTDYIFNGKKEGAYFEDDLPDPAGAYGKSKLLGEINITNALSKYFIFRISWLYGENGNNFVKTMLRLFSDREEVKVVADQWGSPTYTGDVADLIADVINRNNNKFGIYHFTNEGKTNWHEFASLIYSYAKKTGLIKRNVLVTPIKTKEYPTRAKRPVNSYLSKEKIKKIFGISIRTWQEALKECINNIANY